MCVRMFAGLPRHVLALCAHHDHLQPDLGLGLDGSTTVMQRLLGIKCFAAPKEVGVVVAKVMERGAQHVVVGKISMQRMP